MKIRRSGDENCVYQVLSKKEELRRGSQAWEEYLRDGKLSAICGWKDSQGGGGN